MVDLSPQLLTRLRNMAQRSNTRVRRINKERTEGNKQRSPAEKIPKAQGSISGYALLNVYLQQGGWCPYCNQKLRLWDLTIEHVKPLGHGGGHHVGNVILCCEACNKRRAKEVYHYVRKVSRAQAFLPPLPKLTAGWYPANHDGRVSHHWVLTTPGTSPKTHYADTICGRWSGGINPTLLTSEPVGKACQHCTRKSA